jgi:hypothetical protein
LIMAEQLKIDFDSPVAEELNLISVFDEALQAVVKKGPRPEVEARFYPYAGLSSTIRLRQGRVYARVSDILRHSPRETLYALARILVAKLYRVKVPKEFALAYREHTLDPAVLDAAETARRKRGYKLTTSPRGKVYDLEEVFSDLNARYFVGELQRPALSWSAQKTRRVLGHHDHIHDAIVISRTLDSPRIPRFVVEYVLYHEMLHVKHPPRRASGRTLYHSRQFRDDERRFEQFDDALKFLENIALPARRKRRRRA